MEVMAIGTRPLIVQEEGGRRDGEGKGGRGGGRGVVG